MNINNIFGMLENLAALFADWFIFSAKEWSWCPVRVDNRERKF